jgi:hypothetical protein
MGSTAALASTAAAAVATTAATEAAVAITAATAVVAVTAATAAVVITEANAATAAVLATTAVAAAAPAMVMGLSWLDCCWLSIDGGWRIWRTQCSCCLSLGRPPSYSYRKTITKKIRCFDSYPVLTQVLQMLET